MKYINNGILQNIIKDSDVNMSESFQNQNLAEVLTEYKKDLNTLKSNVKWLAKYGGVGGSGGGGGSDGTNVKLKYRLDIKYVNNAGFSTTESFASKSLSNSVLVQYGSRAVLTVTLLKCIPNTNYVVKFIYGEQTYILYVNSLTLTVSQTITCVGNTPLNVIVYATPEDMPETLVLIYTIAKEASLDLKLDNGITVASGSTVLNSYVQNPNTKLIGTLINYLPNLYQGTLTRLIINGTDIPFTITNGNGTSGESVTKFEISVKDVFTNFGIYEVTMYFVYNNIEEEIKNVYVYKDTPVFLYCFGEINTVYAGITNTPRTSNFTVETIKYRIYPEEGYPSNQRYSGTYTITYQDNDTIIEGSFTKESNQDWEVKFSNVYTKNDFTSKDDFKQVTITFIIEGYTYIYYVYVKQTADIEYIFKHRYKDGDVEVEELFYNADHSCTALAAEDTNPNTTFPFGIDGTFKLLLKDETHIITRLADNTSLPEAVSVYGTQSGSGLTGGYITNYMKQGNATDADVLISFGLKYSEFNLDLPIVTIKVNDAASIILYSNKIVYGSNSYSRWFIPNDDLYHLIQLYYKPRYTIDGSSCTEGAPNSTSAFIFCIDGVFETAPIYIDTNNTLVSFIKGTSAITYHPGNWDFNFISVASFNAKPLPSTWKDYQSKFKEKGEILKYVLDFDPIIPANYYQAYYLFTHKVSLEQTFDLAIYPILYSSSDINNKYGINFYKNFNKFVPANIVTLGKLTNLPIYIIEPDPGNAAESDIPINDFLHKTYAGGYNENSDTPSVKCTFKQGIINGEELTEVAMVSETKYRFEITYLGSSTLKYGAKNFEISASDYKEDETYYPILWTPDDSVFLPEKSFTLKADIVDSSHSNNVIVGKFVNDYMASSSFKEEGSKQNIKTCLEGFPILLFMRDTIPSGDNTLPTNTIFLGIYSFNLGRKSVYNLGYKQLNLAECQDISVEGASSKAYLLKSDDAISYPNKYRVAEVLGNSPVLYDYSQYDSLLLGNKMLGDYFNYDGSSENNAFTSDFLRPFLGLNKLIFHKFVKDLNENYEPYIFKANELMGYYKPKSPIGLFNVLQLNFDFEERQSYKDTYHYKPNILRVNRVPTTGLILSKEQVEHVKPYLKYGTNNLSIIGNPKYQFHLICDASGTPIAEGHYYVEELADNPPEFNTSSDDYFDYDTVLRYYVVCMLFAMVDSVLKNLTIRCKDFKPNSSNAWLVGFYDMDTSFGVDNIGNPVDFKAFSDYILPTGKIISDCFKGDSENKEGSGFDVPSSFLFLAAKYLNIITPDGDLATPLGTRTYVNEANATILKTPFNYWLTLRSGDLLTVDKFFEKYVDNHFKNINPLIWNLNYLYKYFSASGTSGGDTDTEQSKFNGTRRYSRKSWLKQRLEVIDVLFGIRNNHAVSNSSSDYICKQKASDDATTLLQYVGFLNSVPIAQSMFPLFKKGVTDVDLEAIATSYPKAPVVLQTSTSDYKLYLADNAGSIKDIRGTVTSNVDIGFFGTTTLKTLNECGLFLWNTSETNTMKNSIINEIIITKCPKNGAQEISFDLANIPSAKTIKVNAEGNTGSIYKGKSFSITTSNDYILDRVEIRYAKFSGPISLTGTKGTLTIKNLILDNCECTKLNLSGIVVLTITISNCSVLAYTLSGEFPTLNITDGHTTSFDAWITGTTDTSITINMAALAELKLQGLISSFKNDTTSANCTAITINTLTAENTTFMLKTCPNFAGQMKIPLSDNVKTLTLLLNDNNKCTEYLFFGGKNLQTVNLEGSAFYKNNALQNISWLKTESSPVLALLLSVPVNIKGGYTFAHCGVSGDLCIPNSSNAKFTLVGTNHNYLYFGNKNLTLQNVINFFNYAESTQTTFSFSFAFSNCENINFYLNSTADGYTLPSAYTNFVQALEKFTQGKSIDFDNIFSLTLFNFLDAKLVSLFKLNGVLKDICPKCLRTNESYIYLTDDFLNPQDNPDIYKITLGNRFGTIDHIYSETMVKFVKRSVENTSLYLQCESADINKILDNGKLSHIAGIHLFTSDDILINCTNGLPSTIKEVKFFNSISGTKYNFLNIENLFDNVTDCNVYMDLFFGGASKVTVKNKVELFKLFWRKEGPVDKPYAVPKVNLILYEYSTLGTSGGTSTTPNRGASVISYSLNFDKTCSKNEFKMIMQYLLDLQYSYLNEGVEPSYQIYNLIPGLFAQCEITNVTTFANLIEADDLKSYFTTRIVTNDEGGVVREINFIDLNRTFYNCSLVKVNNEQVAFQPEIMWEELFVGPIDEPVEFKTKVINLKQTFYNTLQEKILKAFLIRWVKTMLECFYNCTYLSAEGKVLIEQPAGTLSLAYSWAWKDDYPLLPRKFFSGFSNCNISKCFAGSDRSGKNIQGQLPKTKDDLWWGTNDVDTSTTQYTFLYALIHPIKKIEDVKGENEEIIQHDNYYIYPKAYTDYFKTSADAYNHVIMPLLGADDGTLTLFLFEDDTTLLNLTTKLPCLPLKYGTAYYNSILQGAVNNGKQWKVRINKKDTFMNNTSFMSKSSYKNILPVSLFLVLKELKFNTYNMENSKPILYNEGYGYGFTNGYWDGATTPGGITMGRLSSVLQNVIN